MDVDEILMLVVVVLAEQVHLADTERRNLLVPASLAAQLPTKSRPRDQLISDLNELARLGEDHIRRWLRQASLLAGDGHVATVFYILSRDWVPRLDNALCDNDPSRSIQ